jgi:asparagine synthase (glutamine-hydrolysing)
MCGIAGIWNYKTRRPIDSATLKAITTALQHRGPDGSGYYTDGDLGFGHRGLSIIDVTGGHQPMCNEDSTVLLTFNDEIYNYPELREQLLKRGHVLRPHCDTEAIVRLYEDHGENCFNLLREMFAIVLWDQKQQRLILARDRIGIKPLFYGDGRRFWLRAQMYPRIASGSCGSGPHSNRGPLHFQFYRQPPNHLQERSFPGARPLRRIQPRRHPQASLLGVPRQELQVGSENEYQERLYHLLQDAVRSHLLSDVPVGAFLSGGVDSSIVIALMSGMVAEPISTYSIGFQEREFNELFRARIIAEAFGTKHNQRVVTPEPAKILRQLADFYDEPFPDLSSIPTYAVSQLAREQVKVVLSGGGGDENFAGYGHYACQLFLAHCRRTLRPALRQVLSSPYKKWSPEDQSGSTASRIHSNLHQLTLDTRDGYITARSFADADMRAKLFSPDLKHQLRDYDPRDMLRAVYNRGPSFHPLSQAFYLDFKTWLVDDILTKVDRASMVNSLEVRVPLLDHKVVEFAFSLPFGLKLRKGRGKHLLRQAMKAKLPPAHMDLPKKGFRVPLHQWMRGKLRGWGGKFRIR